MNFFNKYKVIILGLLSAIALAVSELIKGGESSTKVLILAGMIAAASFLANNIRGQWASIAGLFGTALTTYLTMQQTGSVSWAQLVLTFVIGLLAILAAPAKSRGYETTPTIAQAKSEGEQAAPTVVPPKP